jgi:MFS family permease
LDDEVKGQKHAKSALADGLRDIPKDIWVVGVVSFLMDVSSESIHSLLPLFMVNTLGVSVLAVGIIDGFAEATTNIVKVFSGSISDYLRKRKALAVAGYGLSALSKPLFPLATNVTQVIAGRVADRIGKGIRGAPRDALMADIVPAHLRGAAFGLRQSLDTAGAFTGPILAVVLMSVTNGNFRTVFWVATIPAILSVLFLGFGVHEPASKTSSSAKSPLRWSDLKSFSRQYWWVVAIGGVFTLARFSEAFLVLRAQNLGLQSSVVPVVMIVMNIAYALSAYPAGVLADRMSHRSLLAAGLVVLILADLALAFATGKPVLFAGVLLWGLHMGLTQGLLSAMVAGCAPERLRGTGFGFFNLVSGVALLPSSAIAGLLWTRIGPSATFLCGGAFAVLTLFAVIGTMRPRANSDR